MKTIFAILIFVTVNANAVPAVKFHSIKAVPYQITSDNCAYFENDMYDDPAEIDHFQGECMGFGGWRLRPYGFDSRSFIKLSHGGQTLDLQKQMAAVGQFPNYEGHVEWRMKMVLNQSAKPFAFLFESSGQKPDDYHKSNGSVFVVKLGDKTSCVMGKVDFDGNDAAQRKAAWKKARLETNDKTLTFNCPLEHSP